jgi:membrane protein YqaA with SNARE-associated domain
MSILSEKQRFLLLNLLKGLLWFIGIIAIYLVLKRLLPDDFKEFLAPLWNKPIIIYLIFFASEVIFGMIPPELFMIWALRNGSVWTYVLIVSSFTLISYLAGIIGYFIGQGLGGTGLYQRLSRRYLEKYEKYVYNYSALLIIVAATTPVPFSATCMVVGAVRYPFRKFLLYTITRVVRFSIYAYFVWESNVFLKLSQLVN